MQLSYATITSPINGRTGSLSVRPVIGQRRNGGRLSL